MTSPLYQTHKPLPAKPDQSSHIGLWFDRFFDRYESQWTLDNTAKLNWLKTIGSQKVGDLKALENHSQRQQQLVQNLAGRGERYQAEWNFVTGMGNPHPIENGFSWHPTLGVPYLNGAAVKGLIRAWVESREEHLSETEYQQRLINWFGSANSNDQNSQTGGYLFFDALPDQCPQLVIDIMTPHMGKWYSDGDKKADLDKGNNIPADWHEPTPIPFLAVQQLGLIFNIAPRNQQQADELDKVFKALDQALTWLGAGAKTSSGYGYFKCDRDYSQQQAKAAEKQRQAQTLSKLSPAQQEIEILRQRFQQSNASEKMGGELYSQMKRQIDNASDWSSEDKQSLKSLAQQIVELIGAKDNKKVKQLIRTLDE